MELFGLSEKGREQHISKREQHVRAPRERSPSIFETPNAAEHTRDVERCK